MPIEDAEIAANTKSISKKRPEPGEPESGYSNRDPKKRRQTEDSANDLTAQPPEIIAASFDESEDVRMSDVTNIEFAVDNN